LIAQIVFAAIKSGLSPAAFQQYDTESGSRQFLRNNASAGACADHHRVYMLECDQRELSS
jgi:hypothetical protein